MSIVRHASVHTASQSVKSVCVLPVDKYLLAAACIGDMQDLDAGFKGCQIGKMTHFLPHLSSFCISHWAESCNSAVLCSQDAPPPCLPFSAPLLSFWAVQCAAMSLAGGAGSMRGPRETVAKALALECMRAAKAQERGCYVFAFAGPQEVCLCPSHCSYLPVKCIHLLSPACSDSSWGNASCKTAFCRLHCSNGRPGLGPELKGLGPELKGLGPELICNMLTCPCDLVSTA